MNIKKGMERIRFLASPFPFLTPFNTVHLLPTPFTSYNIFLSLIRLNIVDLLPIFLAVMRPKHSKVW